MPVQSVVCDTEKIRICAAVGKCVEVSYSVLSGTRLEQEAQLIQLLQGLLDYRQRRNQLPRDDPDRATDPDRPDLFWDGQFLIHRPITVTGARWNETESRFVIGLERAGAPA
jgi:hypothetical protein